MIFAYLKELVSAAKHFKKVIDCLTEYEFDSFNKNIYKQISLVQMVHVQCWGGKQE